MRGVFCRRGEELLASSVHRQAFPNRPRPHNRRRVRRTPHQHRRTPSQTPNLGHVSASQTPVATANLESCGQGFSLRFFLPQRWTGVVSFHNKVLLQRRCWSAACVRHFKVRSSRTLSSGVQTPASDAVLQCAAHCRAEVPQAGHVSAPFEMAGGSASELKPTHDHNAHRQQGRFGAQRSHV